MTYEKVIRHKKKCKLLGNVLPIIREQALSSLKPPVFFFCFVPNVFSIQLGVINATMTIVGETERGQKKKIQPENQLLKNYAQFI